MNNKVLTTPSSQTKPKTTDLKERTHGTAVPLSFINVSAGGGVGVGGGEFGQLVGGRGDMVSWWGGGDMVTLRYSQKESLGWRLYALFFGTNPPAYLLQISQALIH